MGERRRDVTPMVGWVDCERSPVLGEMRRVGSESRVTWVMVRNVGPFLVMWENFGIRRVVERSGPRMVFCNRFVWMDDIEALVDGLLGCGSCVCAGQAMCRRR